MKKLMAIITALMVMAGCAFAFAAETTLTREEAMQAALDYAGLKAEQVSFTRIQMDLDDGRRIYEIEFIYNGIEYEMDVDIYTGRVFEADRDCFDRYDYDDHDDDWDDWFDFD
jgi:uncharacterized membrane protein YkoI